MTIAVDWDVKHQSKLSNQLSFPRHNDCYTRKVTKNSTIIVIKNWLLYEYKLNSCYSGYLQTGALANIEDPDEMPLNTAFQQSLHCLPIFMHINTS